MFTVLTQQLFFQKNASKINTVLIGIAVIKCREVKVVTFIIIKSKETKVVTFACIYCSGHLHSKNRCAVLAHLGVLN